MSEEILTADLVWTGRRFEEGVQLRIGADGRIAEIGHLGLQPTRELRRRALLPGFVNAHSHAFQRGLRGRGEHFPAGAGSFWSWREAMYQLVADLDRDRFVELCRRAFREMLAAGITTVGEFHYLHHLGPGRDFELDAALLQAAREAGIRLVLLEAYYRTGGVGKPLAGAQARFATESPGEYWRQVERLGELLDPRTQSLGAVVHSIRAADLDDLEAVHGEAMARGMVCHLHVEEQRKEIEECVAVHGRPPMAILVDRLEISERTTAVHCTHTARADMVRYLRAGGNVCLCPLTEANLGDGIADLPGILADAGHRQICLGTDSNARLSMTEEVRWLEYVQRLRHEMRGVCRDREGELGRPLLAAATEGGARALGLPAGRLQARHHADLLAVDLDDPSLAGSTPETLLEAFLLGARDTAIADVAVGGRWTSEG